MRREVGLSTWWCDSREPDDVYGSVPGEVGSGYRVAVSSARHTELGELCGNGLAVSGGPDMLVYVRNPAVGANVERPPGRERLIRVDHPVGVRDRLRRIAQERIVHTK